MYALAGGVRCLSEARPLFALLPRAIGRPLVPQAGWPAVQLSGAVSGAVGRENIWGRVYRQGQAVGQGPLGLLW